MTPYPRDTLRDVSTHVNLLPPDQWHTHTGFTDCTPRRADPRQVGYERGLNRVILALVTAVAIALALVAVASLHGCAAPQLPRTDAERVTYCANLERARADVQRYADTEDARWAFNDQLDELARAGGCKP